MARALTEFPTVRSQGALLPPDILLRIKAQDLDGTKGKDFGLASGIRLQERISEDWGRARAQWADFQKARESLKEGETGATETRTKWLGPLFRTLEFGDLEQVAGPELEGKHYPIRYFYKDSVPLHLLGCNTPNDRRSQGVQGASTGTPHSLVQEFLNRSDEHLWAVLSNGLQLRLLRDNVSLSRQAFVEFDLEAMMEGEVYADFSLLWMLLHASRFHGEQPEDCWLEKWSKAAASDGARVLGGLRDGVTQAIEKLGQGFLGHPTSDGLRDRLRSGDLSTQELYRQVLRTVYRLLFLFVAEDRDLLHSPNVGEERKRRYFDYYSLSRIRGMADRMRGTGHGDLWQGLTRVFRALEAEGSEPLGLSPLGSFLWASSSTPDLLGASQAEEGGTPVEIANEDLLDVVRSLAFTEMDGVRRAVDYRNLGAEELGSVYESLLELTPEVRAGDTAETSRFDLSTVAGNERKTSGSYYTPDSLVQCLLDSALDPVVGDRLKDCKTAEQREEAILSMTVCDPAVGSGHFLIAAAHRLARVLAGIRTGDQEPAPENYRHALRDVISRCLYGVDVNPMSAELCRVALWMEAMEPGKPLSFLDHHIVVGNSLIGATPELLAQDIPDGAYKPLEGDDKNSCTAVKKKNKEGRKYAEQGMQVKELFVKYGEAEEDPLSEKARTLESSGGDNLEATQRMEGLYRELRADPVWQRRKLASDAWCAAFVWKKDGSDLGFQCPTTTTVERILEDANYPQRHPQQVAEIRRLAREFQFFHWHLAFPHLLEWNIRGAAMRERGFDVSLGNPPWERVKLQEKEWFATRDEQIARAPARRRKALIKDLAAKEPALHQAFLAARRHAEGISHFLRESGRFPLCGRGDVNTYTVFAEHFRNLAGPRGRSGCIVPSGIATDDTTKHFFQSLVRGQSLASLFDFENRKGIFKGVHSLTKFSALTMTGPSWPIEEAKFVFFAHDVRDLEDEERRFTLSAEDIRLVNPNTLTTPIFRTRRDAKITKGIYKRVPVLIDETREDGNPWGIKFARMFDMSNDSHLFRMREELEADGWALEGNTFVKGDDRMVPLYEGKMFWQMDPSWATCKGGDFRLVTDEEKAEAETATLGRYWVPAAEVAGQCAALGISGQWLFGYRNITNTTNERTLVASMMPPSGTGNSVLLLAHPKAEHPIVRALALGTFLGTLVVDYASRQKLGGSNFTYNYFRQIPVLNLEALVGDCETPLGTRLLSWLISRAIELSCFPRALEGALAEIGASTAPQAWDASRRRTIRCELDALAFHLYGISRDDVDYILDTFPIVAAREQEQFGEYRLKLEILEIYDVMAAAQEAGVPWQSSLNPAPEVIVEGLDLAAMLQEEK